jgi:predicted Zn-dependent peptidase
MSSRLFQNIRERRGLVYSIESNLNLFRDAGALVVYAGVAPSAARQVVKLTLGEFRKLGERLVSEDELKRAKEFVKGSLMLSLESSSSRMTHLAHQEIYHGRFHSPEAIIKRIDKVTARDVLRLANEVFDPSAITLAALGGDEGQDLDSLFLGA